MKLKTMSTSKSIKCGPQTDFFTDKDFNIHAFKHPGLDVPLIRIEYKQKGNVTYTTFANVAHFTAEDSEFSLKKKAK